mgnify:CR=1 FL=1
MAKPLSFKDFIVVDYRPGMGELINYRATKRRRLGEEPEVSEEETTDEALDFQARRARARSMKKNKAKIAMGQRKARKRAANPERLKKRASKSARGLLFKKFSKGKSKDELPFAQRQAIEKRLDKMKGRIAKMAVKILPDIRKREKNRRSGGTK